MLTQEQLALINQAAATGPNMTETVSGGGGGRLLPEGYSLGRLVEYIELGAQPQEYNGKPKDPKHEFQLGFALYSPGYANEDGSPYIVRPYSITIDQNEKANAVKVFKTLNWKADRTHFAQFLGEAFLIAIEHKPVDKSQPNGKKRSVVNLLKTLPPLDALTKAPYQVPEVDPKLIRLFLWDYPTLEAWNSLFVEGTWDDGGSKNRTQEKILSALDFSGSALEQLFLKTGTAYKVPEKKAAAAPTAPAAPAGGVASVAPVAPAAGPAAPAVEASPAPFVPGVGGPATAAQPYIPQVGSAPTGAPGVSGTTPTQSPSEVKLPAFPAFNIPGVA